jgi:hypothetical protein
LQKLIESSECSRLRYAQHIERCGKRFVEEICARDLEGIVAKRKLSVYKDEKSRKNTSICTRTNTTIRRTDLCFPLVPVVKQAETQPMSIVLNWSLG